MPAFAGMTALNRGKLALLALLGWLRLLGFRGLWRLGCGRSFFGAVLGFVLTGGNFVGGGLGHQGDGLRRPVVILDPTVEAKRLVEPRDLVVGEIGDLLELDQPELVQLGLELRRDAGDQLQIIGLSGRLLEAFEGLALLAARRLALGDAGSLAAASTQIIELGAAHAAATNHLDRIGQRRMNWEDALDALAIGNLAHGEVLVDPAAGPADADAFIGLHAGAVAFDHLDVNAERVAGPEL